MSDTISKLRAIGVAFRTAYIESRRQRVGRAASVLVAVLVTEGVYSEVSSGE